MSCWGGKCQRYQLLYPCWNCLWCAFNLVTVAPGLAGWHVDHTWWAFTATRWIVPEFGPQLPEGNFSALPTRRQCSCRERYKLYRGLRLFTTIWKFLIDEGSNVVIIPFLYTLCCLINVHRSYFVTGVFRRHMFLRVHHVRK